MKSLGKIGDLIIVFLAVTINGKLATFLSKLIFPYISSLDPDGVFLYQCIRHLLMLLFAMGLMKLWLTRRLGDYGFNFKNYKLSLKVFFWFSIIYLIPVFLVNVLPYICSGKGPSFQYPLNARNVTCKLSYLFLLTGATEEPLFRGFAVVLLSQSWKGQLRFGRIAISSAGLIATILFMYAHISFTILPFKIVHISLLQQVWGLGLGLYYATVFQRTGSLLCPVLSHGYSNGIVFTILYILAFVMR